MHLHANDWLPESKTFMSFENKKFNHEFQQNNEIEMSLKKILISILSAKELDFEL